MTLGFTTIAFFRPLTLSPGTLKEFRILLSPSFDSISYPLFIVAALATLRLASCFSVIFRKRVWARLQRNE